MLLQEGLVLLIDVGPSMHSVLPEVEKVCSMLVQKKVRGLIMFEDFEFESISDLWMS